MTSGWVGERAGKRKCGATRARRVGQRWPANEKPSESKKMNIVAIVGSEPMASNAIDSRFSTTQLQIASVDFQRHWLIAAFHSDEQN